MMLAGGVARFVRRQIECKHRDFLRGAEPAHRLAIDEVLPYGVDRLAGFLRSRVDALVERRRFDRAGTNRIRANALSDEVGRDRLGKPDYGRLAGAIDV